MYYTYKRSLVTKEVPIPKHSMYGIFTYIGMISGVNVGIYTIHGASGIYVYIYIYMTIAPNLKMNTP